MTLFAVMCAGMFPVLHTGPSVAGILVVPVSEHDELLAAIPQPAGVGRVRGVDVLHDFAGVLVHRPGS